MSPSVRLKSHIELCYTVSCCAVLFLAVMYYIVPVPCHNEWLDALPCSALLCHDVLHCAGLGFALGELAAVL